MKKVVTKTKKYWKIKMINTGIDVRIAHRNFNENPILALHCKMKVTALIPMPNCMILWEYQLEIWSSRFHMMTLYKSINKISDAGSIIAKLPWQKL